MSDKTIDDIKSGKGISKDVPKPDSSVGNSNEQRNDNSGTRVEQLGVEDSKKND